MWYTEPDLDVCFDVLRPYIGSRTLAYGSSMGGYAAVQFADRLGIERALALSPQVSLNPAIMPEETRWWKHASRIEFVHDDLARDRKAFAWIFSDPNHVLDASHARRLAELGAHRLVWVPNSGHPVGVVLKEIRLLVPFLRSFLAGTEDQDDMARLVRERIHQSPTANLNKGKNLPDDERKIHLRKAFEASPNHPKIACLQAQQLMKDGLVEDSEAIFVKLFALNWNNQYRAVYREECERLGIPARLLDD